MLLRACHDSGEEDSSYGVNCIFALCQIPCLVVTRSSALNVHCNAIGVHAARTGRSGVAGIVAGSDASTSTYLGVVEWVKVLFAPLRCSSYEAVRVRVGSFHLYGTADPVVVPARCVGLDLCRDLVPYPARVTCSRVSGAACQRAGVRRG